MARPKKTGLDYFSMDVDIVQDIKIRKLLKHKGGARALGVFMYLLCRIYKNGYYLDYDEDTIFLVSEDLHEEENYITEIVEECLKVGLFDKTLYSEHGVLTSHGIQERYVEVQAHFKRSSTISKYDLLIEEESSDDVSSAKTRVSSEETAVTSEETRNNHDNIGLNKDIDCISSSKSTQKGKERKIERKNNIIPSSTSPAREESEVFDEETFQEDGLNAEIDLLLKDSIWSESVTSRFKLPQEYLGKYIEAFRSECLARGKLRHTSVEDIKSHFSDWLRIQIEKQNNYASDYGKSRHISQGNSAQATDLRRPAPITPGARQADFSGTF